MSSAFPSSMTYFPTPENPNGAYKYISIELNLSQDFKQWNR